MTNDSIKYKDLGKPLLACGHTANSVRVMPDGTEAPACAICALIVEPNPVIETPDLTGREAVCLGCRKNPASRRPSELSLPFFEYRPGNANDSYYCGCWGWD